MKREEVWLGLSRHGDLGVCRKGLQTLARKMLIAFALVWFD